ncbi:MAG: S9 family peptidase [Flavobacteriaceae bacterium]|nr:S9 family peptidase [Flavobacteriaceae bacterium]
MERTPPKAIQKPHTLEIHGDKRIDPFFWMREKDSEEVKAYLEAENTYFKEEMSDHKDFQEALFQEMKSRIKENDNTVPYKYNGYWYITRYEIGKDYPIYTRKKESLEAEEEVLFDCNQMAKGHNYFHLRGINISEDNRFAAFGVDTLSRRQYQIQIKDLQTGEILPESIQNTTGASTWAKDNASLFYTRKDAVTLRSHSIYKHKRGAKVEEDVLVYEEIDETFNTFIYKSKSNAYLIIGSGSTMTSEYQILEADNPDGEFRMFQKRTRGLEYGISHFEDKFYIVTNKDNAVNFQLMETELSKTESIHWKTLIAHRDAVLLEDIDVFKDYLVVTERSNGLTQLQIRPWDANKKAYYLPFESNTYTAYSATNVDFDTHVLRYGYSSFTTPMSVIDFNMHTKEKVVMKEQEVLDANFDKTNYRSQRIWAEAEDGTQIPISMVHHKDTILKSDTPLLLYAYGAYGYTLDVYFSSSRLTLLNRGFVYAVAHVRGGEYLGRNWYETGKLFEKKNTFTDFVACSQHLIAQNYTSNQHLYAMGGSAGGLLMGVIANTHPQLFRGIVASVPFVDVVTTMLDESIPLTTGEYDEWGNPNQKAFYDYIKSYSPYDNICAQNYPHMFVTSGYHDSQVQYWEPTKWVAKLREANTADTKILYHCNMDTGHGGSSGRFEALKELAEEYTFLFCLEGISN